MILNPSRILKSSALRYAGDTAVVNFERNRRFTYQQVREITNRACHMLARTFGLDESDRIATLVRNDHMSLLYLMSMKSMCGSLWLGVMDSFHDHLYQLDHVRPSLVFIENDLLPAYYAPLRERGIAMVTMDPLGSAECAVPCFWDLIREHSPEEPDMQFTADDAAKHASVYRFTGGTTGRGKCACYSLSNLLSSGTNLSYTEVIPYPHPRVLLSTPITHAAGAIILPTYFQGGTLITLNSADIETFCRAIEKEKADLIYTVPTVLYRMIDMHLAEKYDLSSLKTIRYGAAPMSPAKLEALVRQFGPIFIQGYAATEAWVPGTLLSREEHDPSCEAGRRKLTSVGRPVPGMEFKIADDEGNERPVNTAGEIWIRGPHVIQGYYDAPEETRAAFTADGFWKSGDIGCMDAEGFIYLLDRKKDMIISGGFNVYPAEVENCINSHSSVEQCVVVGIPDEKWGERVHAEVILKKDRDLTPSDLIAYCKGSLARYKAPKSVRFVEQLPTSSVGKLLRRPVREKYLPAQDA